MPCEYGFTRTNYFRVTDLDTMDFLMSGVIADDFEVLLRNHSICIRCAGEIQGIDNELFEDTGAELEDFLKLLQHLLPDGEAIVLVYAGATSSQDIEGYYYVATNNKIVHKNLYHSGVETAQTLTKNENFYFRY